jgi:hypothetical protein
MRASSLSVFASTLIVFYIGEVVYRGEGFVTLSTAGAGEGDVLPSRCYADSLAPCSEGRRPEFSIRVGGNEMAAGVERVVDGGVSGQEALR